MALTRQADVYLITRCAEDDPATYEAVHTLLEQHGLFDAGFNRNKHLSCSTVIGKAHIARQLESKIHVDADEEVINHLQRFTPHLMLINSSHGESVKPIQRASGILVAYSLQQQFHK